MRTRRRVGIALLALAAAGCHVTLPEEGSRAAELYRHRCAPCHRLYPPSVLKYAMWEVVVARMDQQIARARMPPLSEEEKRVILAYLERHAG